MIPQHGDGLDALVVWTRILRRTVRLPSGCWEWTGATSSNGYGTVSASGHMHLVHRVAVLAHLPIPPGLTVDHTCHDPYTCPPRECRHRRCVNPAHLAIVTTGDNNRRRFPGSTCPKGHPLVTRRNGRRRCPTCARLYTQDWRKGWRTRQSPRNNPGGSPTLF